ncbi:hypothetical protein Tco_0892703 [Tanacetum coccineum]|uniref:Uncharacterized protein n=1 Tax=Tanacetum coccineum TaxID=301880 RepID=A0ABQ5C6X3_9ASTR
MLEEESTESEAKSWGRDEDDSNNDHDLSNEGSDQESDSSDDNSQYDKEKESNSEHATDENESGFKSDQEENEEDVKDDEEEQDDEFVKTLSNSTDDEDETNVDSKNALIQKEGTDAEMINVQQGNENPEITLNQVIEDAHVTISTVSKKTEVPLPTIITILHSSTTTINTNTTPTTEATNPPSALLNFASVFQFNNRVTTLEKEVAELKKYDPLNTQVTALILPKKVSNFAPPVIKSMVTESLEHVVLAKESSQPKSTYEAAASLTEFELKKILIDKIDESQSYLTTTEHRECYDGLIKSYDLDKRLFSTYDKVYSLKRTEKTKIKMKTLPLDQPRVEERGR